MSDHTFAICAYKESPYLQDCINSLKNQSVQSNIILITSTPCDYISDIADKNNIPLYVNSGEKGITQDWNYAYKTANTEWVTIAHQDDVYQKDYAKFLSLYKNAVSHPLIFFTDYAELRNGSIVEKSLLLTVKRILLLPLRAKILWNCKVAKWFALAFGTAICCPSVTFYKPNLPDEVFAHNFRADEDWEAWERIYHLKGAFIFCNKKLVLHRIHVDSETTKILADNKRTEEDYVMFKKFWISPIAFLITKLYSLSQRSNSLG